MLVIRARTEVPAWLGREDRMAMKNFDVSELALDLGSRFGDLCLISAREVRIEGPVRFDHFPNGAIKIAGPRQLAENLVDQCFDLGARHTQFSRSNA